MRVNPASPYRVTRAAWSSTLDGELADVELPPMPAYYRHTLSNGKTVMETAPTIQWGYLIYLTVLRLCQYFGAKEECRFCDINHNWRQHKQAGRPYTGIKPVEDVLEALAIIAEHDDGASHAYTLTGGSVTSKVDGLAEADFYGRYAQAIEERFPGRWIGKVVAQALPREDVQRYRTTGSRSTTRTTRSGTSASSRSSARARSATSAASEWHRRILDAAEVFGPRHVIPNFVAGRRDGEAVRVHDRRRGDRLDSARGSTSSCGAGSRRASRRGARSRRRRSAATTRRARRSSTTCGCSRPTATCSSGTACSRRPGYGEPGAGNAVFSVSSFMDVLAPRRCRCEPRSSVDEARELWLEASDEELMARAQAVRARWHRPDHATYMVMRIVNYTNVCVAQCDYCAFYVLPNQDGGYVLSREDVFAKIDELLEVGGDLVGFNGGFNPKLPLDYYCDLFASVRERYGERVEFYALTVAEFVFLADRAGLSYAEAAARLRDAGVHWVTGGGSEILTEDFRKRHAKWKYTVADYFEAQRAIVESGMRTTATMVIGFDETLDERLEHLQRTRDFQDDCLADGHEGLFSFLCWTYKPYGTALGGTEISARGVPPLDRALAGSSSTTSSTSARRC